MATITKKDLVDRVASDTKHRRVDIKETIRVFLEHIADELAKGNRIEFRDFGVFEVRMRAPRTAQNPRTLKPVMVPAKRTVKFKPGRSLRESLENIEEPVDIVTRAIEPPTPAGVTDNGQKEA